MTEADRQQHLVDEQAVAAIVLEIAEAVDTYDERVLGERLRHRGGGLSQPDSSSLEHMGPSS